MSIIKGLATKGLTSKTLLGDMRRQNNFVVHISGVTENNDLDLIIQTAFLPKVSLNPIEIRHGNDAVKFAGVATWQGGQITILDVLSRRELDAVLSWFEQTYNPSTGQIGIAKDYKKSGRIDELAPNGEYVRSWNIEGMWISDFDLGQLDATSGEVKQIQFTIQIDPMKSIRPTYKKYGTTPDGNSPLGGNSGGDVESVYQ